MDFVWCRHKFVGEGKYIVNRLAGTYCAFQNVECAVSAVPNVFLMPLSKIKRYCLFPLQRAFREVVPSLNCYCHILPPPHLPDLQAP